MAGLSTRDDEVATPERLRAEPARDAANRGPASTKQLIPSQATLVFGVQLLGMP